MANFIPTTEEFIIQLVRAQTKLTMKIHGVTLYTYIKFEHGTTVSHLCSHRFDFISFHSMYLKISPDCYIYYHLSLIFKQKIRMIKNSYIFLIFHTVENI